MRVVLEMERPLWIWLARHGLYLGGIYILGGGRR